MAKRKEPKTYLIEQKKPNYLGILLILVSIFCIIIGAIGFNETQSDGSINEGYGFANYSCFILLIISGASFLFSIFYTIENPETKIKEVKIHEVKNG